MPLSPEQLEQRRGGIGASEIAAIMGANPYQSKLDVWMEKVGLLPGFKGNKHTERGALNEPKIAKLYASLHNASLDEPTETLVHPDYPWVMATPDRIWKDRSRVVEIKNPLNESTLHYTWGPSGSDIMPEMYYLQVQWQMAVTGIQQGDLVALIEDERVVDNYREYPIEGDAELQAHMIRVGREFWFDNVVAEEPPAPRDETDEERYLNALYPRDDGTVISANQNAEIAMNNLRLAERAAKAAEAEVKRQKNILKKIMKNSMMVVGQTGRKFVWQTYRSGTRVARMYG